MSCEVLLTLCNEESTMAKRSVAFVGNFTAFSTESDVRYTLEDIGWSVIAIQENQPVADDVICAALNSNLFLWIHTHGWETPDVDMAMLVDELRDRHIPTVGLHLDRYAGLQHNDRREELIGVHPWWHMDHIFTADGGNQELFASRGVRHHWLPPAIALKYCWLGTPHPEYACDVTFVGSRLYHPEYPFRTQMVDWLDSKHPWTFRRWGGGDRPYVREELNDIFVSSKIVVGDSCFAGAPYYFSDRVTEVTGRGGFLVHPYCEGLEHVGIGRYAPQDLRSLDEAIRYYLEHDAERREMARQGYEWTRTHATWHQRLPEVFRTIGLRED
jgi:hypothetical protein